ncbi:hypothetical protein GWK47_011697 [Chionoecetes opilio]|uniref:Uncharacterized protein n=1 Tax=Chionoecetes opilio TaxID=41210 RepID=A0A8J4XXR7_CHIOP|nr:hypothetical protein GWK47_011697 [Chionoecetes opilio]
MILYAAEIRKLGYKIDIYSSDTDVLVIAMTMLSHPGPEVTLIMGTGENRRRIELHGLFDRMDSHKISGLCGMHALTGCDTTGRIHGKGKLTCFNVYMSSSKEVIHGLAALGIGDAPTDNVLRACTKYICSLFGTQQINHDNAEDLRWYMFRQLKAHQGVERLPPTQGAILQLVSVKNTFAMQYLEAIT